MTGTMHTPYLLRETAISIAINCALTLAFYGLVFGLSAPVPVWGVGHYVADFAPQGFMIGLMSNLVPGALAGRALRTGRLAPMANPALLPARLIPRALLVALLGAAVGVAGAAVVLHGIGAQVLPNGPALAAKLAFAAALAAIATPLGLHAALARTGAPA